jgi:flagellar motor switch protein FliN/FliY
VDEQKDDNSLEESAKAGTVSEGTDGEVSEDADGMDAKSLPGSDNPGYAEDAEGARDLEFILDIPLDISVELGRTKMLVNELLQLGQGSIVELAKLADEPMDIYVNRKLFARGEVVVVNEKFGIRLTDIISPVERVTSLG